MKALTVHTKPKSKKRLSVLDTVQSEPEIRKEQDTTWQLARLKVQVTSLAMENDRLRKTSQELTQQLSKLSVEAKV